MKMFLVLFVGICILNNCLAQPSASNDSLKKAIEERISKTGGTVAVAFEDLTTGATLFINEKEQFHAASTMKTPVMIEVFRQAANGIFSLSDSILIKNEFKSIVDGSTFALNLGEDSDDVVYQKIGSKMTIYELVFQMITVSSNFATNVLIDLVDAKQVQQTMESLGAKNIRVLRGVEDIKAFDAGLNNTTDAFDMCLIMKAIAQQKIVSIDACNQMLEILFQQKFNDKIPAHLPAAVRVAHKTGSITGIDHDAAIVYPAADRPYILVVLTKGIESHQQAKALIADISKQVFDAVVK